MSETPTLQQTILDHVWRCRHARSLRYRGANPKKNCAARRVRPQGVDKSHFSKCPDGVSHVVIHANGQAVGHYRGEPQPQRRPRLERMLAHIFPFKQRQKS